ncbi:Tetratricopeptide repeat-containing protein [Thermoactinomyces sp. DSM 45891]|uniref:tetratricopeptide repeat protein n=1 Tax=Thermoactinomyces sp. DSM 45891 TaxID=1761907 RepID=UPI00090EE124|nr:tetratricopeptide repeat protein [Thermoactinomyces sp. DSM 45891]SFX44235.1 Tetratricopeptide repeat-containing protein [Thermoactinomyces sp. DSM 45891]
MTNSVIDSSLLWIRGIRIPASQYKRIKMRLEQSLQGEPSRTYYLELARLELRKQNYGLAMEAVEEALQLDPTDAESQLLYANILELTGEWDRAKSVYRTNIMLHPVSAQGYREYGRFLLSMDHDDSVLHIRSLILKGLELDPKDSYAHTILAEIYWKLNQRSQAELHLEIGLRYLQEEPWIHQRRASILAELERFDESAHHYKQALKEDKKNIYIRHQLQKVERLSKQKTI